MKPTIMFLVTLQLVIFLQLACSGTLVTGLCVEGFPYFESTQRANKENIASNLLFLPSYKFTCYGRVAQWGVYVDTFPLRYGGTGSIDLQVWRPEKSGNKVLNYYHFVGNNHVPSFRTGRLIVNIPEDQQIEVEPFDIVGVTVSLSMLVFQSSTRMWYSIINLTPNPSTTVCLDDNPDPASNLKSTVDYKPIIMAVVDTTNTTQAPTIVTPHPTATMDTPNSTMVIQFTMDTPSTPANPVTPPSRTVNPVTTATVSLTVNMSPTPPSGLGTDGVIGISVSFAGLLLLTLIILLVIVIACYYRLRRRVLNQQVGVARPLPPIPPNNLQMRPAGIIVDTDSESSDQDFNDQEREQLFRNTRRNIAYHGLPSVVNPVERVNDDNSDDDGYERIPIPVCGPYEQLQYSK